MKLLITNIKQLVTMAGVAKKGGRKPQKEDLAIISNAALLIENEKISWIGKNSEAKKFKKCKILDAKGAVILPGLIDSHTHLIFAGSRHEEFAKRSEGKTYLEIAKEGGGILSTVRETQKAPLNTLIKLAHARIQKARSFGITTLEAKSGYGLSLKDELKCLTALQKLSRTEKINLVSTFMGAHDFPPEFKDNKEAYVELLCKVMIPQVAQKKLAKFCDVFIDEGFYTLSQTEKILKTAITHDLRIRIHADEFKPLGGTELAVSLNAKSVDHLMAVTEQGISALAHSHTVATLLPGTSFFLGKTYAPARKLIDAGVCVALATDFNPGSSVTQNLLLVGTLAVTQMKLTLSETLSAMTYNAAKGLGQEALIGSIEVSKQADLAFFDIPSYEYLLYHFGDNFCKKVIWKGKPTEF
ncbi:MAG: imidazolonepropionase [Deltaproteobacteria bacterium]|nr:imidazolonepropionase [Deltaproteobacteria bacterium]